MFEELLYEYFLFFRFDHERSMLCVLVDEVMMFFFMDSFMDSSSFFYIILNFVINYFVGFCYKF
jgi:hypothetical protein